MIVARPAYALLGLVLVVAGLAGLVAIGIAVFGTCGSCQVWALRLGLGLACLLSGIAQGMALVGGWLIWASRRRAGELA
ncbi:hypothetical protein [Phenylobacterium sp.]|uniref:hypothetical protein n=1 Tax=Phenylobacterium sp. TaxID=1871053 RepID=UPI002ED869D7